MDLLKIRQRAKEAKAKQQAGNAASGAAPSPAAPSPAAPSPASPPSAVPSPASAIDVVGGGANPAPSGGLSTTADHVAESDDFGAKALPQREQAPPSDASAVAGSEESQSPRTPPQRSVTTAARRAPTTESRAESGSRFGVPLRTRSSPSMGAPKAPPTVRPPSTSFRAAPADGHSASSENDGAQAVPPASRNANGGALAFGESAQVSADAGAAVRPSSTVALSPPRIVSQDEDPLREFLVRYDDVDEGDALPSTAEGDLDKESYRRYLAFELEDEEYAISIMDVREILAVVSVTPVPRAPEFILGVFSKRGVVMPILDLAAVLKLRAPSRRMQRTSRVLVVGDADHVCGLRVDALHDAVRLREEDIEPVPSGLETKTAMLLDGLGRIGDRMLILLDGEALLSALRQATSERAVEAREAS